MTTLTAPARTRRLLAAGLVAGPLFIGTGLTQAATREGFDLTRHPLSLLALGDGGWVQVAAFVVTGALTIACAAGMRRVPDAGTWGPRLLGVFGAGLVAAGVFVTDAGAGFPAGAPAGAPEMSWHGILHEVGFGVAMLGWTAASVVLTRRFAVRRQWARAGLTAAGVLGPLLVAAWPDPNSLSVRLVVASAIQFAVLAGLAANALGEDARRA
ncbi:DUF998 domain-containing protein [Pseudonocardia saturnea]